jgi:hypothetical protein
MSFFDGTVDDIRVYKKALTATDVSELYGMYVKTPNYINESTTPVTVAFGTVANVIDFGILSLKEPTGVTAGLVTLYAFVLDNNRLSGKSDIELFLSNIGSLTENTHYYKRTFTTTGTYTSTWDVPTFNYTQVLDSAFTSTDVSLKTFVYAYVVSKHANGSVNYFKQLVNRTFPAINVAITETTVGSTLTVEKATSPIVSIQEYYIMVFSGQPSVNEVEGFVRIKVRGVVPATTTPTLNDIGGGNGFKVYSYRSSTLPTPVAYQLPTDINFLKALFTVDEPLTGTTLSINTTNVFTAYVVGIDATGAYNTASTILSSSDLSIGFSTNEPIDNSLTLSSGTLTVSTHTSLSKFYMMTFVSKQTDEDVITFASTLSAVTSPALYKNESLRYPGSTLDLTSLGITFTEAFNGVADTTSTAILAVNETYYTYVVATDYNANVIVQRNYLTRQIDESSFRDPGKNAFTYIDNTYVTAYSIITNDHWDQFRFNKTSGIYIENTPGVSYVFEYKFDYTTNDQIFIHGFAFVPEGTNTSPFNLINWISNGNSSQSSSWEDNSITRPFANLLNNVTYYIKVTVPQTLGDLIISIYTDPSYSIIYNVPGFTYGADQIRTQTEAINTFINTNTISNYTNQSPSKPWLISISASRHSVQSPNKKVTFGNFRRIV